MDALDCTNNFYNIKGFDCVNDFDNINSLIKFKQLEINEEKQACASYEELLDLWVTYRVLGAVFFASKTLDFKFF